jgi:hypothetical protein
LGGDEERKKFFFEKKNQKTFGYLDPCRLQIGSKSFLLLFFKKEVLACLRNWESHASA